MDDLVKIYTLVRKSFAGVVIEDGEVIGARINSSGEAIAEQFKLFRYRTHEYEIIVPEADYDLLLK